MSAHENGVVDVVAQAINNKFSNIVFASTVAVVGQVSDKISPPPYKPLSEIPITDIFTEPQSAANIITMICCLWIIMQIFNFCGVFKFAAWLLGKIRARKN